MIKDKRDVNKRLDVVFTADYAGLEGFGATVSSLINYCSGQEHLKIWILLSDHRDILKQDIEELFNTLQFSGAFEVVYIDPQARFGKLPGLFNNHANYGKLLIPSIVPSRRALYLDTDMLVFLDVLELVSLDFEDMVIAAQTDATLEYTLDKRALCEELGWDINTPYFNSGVMLWNLEKWRREGYDDQIDSAAAAYSSYCHTKDQCLLNIVAGKKFVQLPYRYNVQWRPNAEQPKEFNNNSIIHFVGSPKPWDYGARWIHQGHAAWKIINPESWAKKYSSVSVAKLSRTWEIRRSLMKNLSKKIKGPKKVTT